MRDFGVSGSDSKHALLWLGLGLYFYSVQSFFVRSCLYTCN